MTPFGHDPDRPANPLTDEQTKAQVLDPAKQIATVANLPNVSGVFGWESCNDQGDPPSVAGWTCRLTSPPEPTDRLFRTDRYDDDWPRLVGWSAAGQAAVRPGNPHGRRHGDHRNERRDGKDGSVEVSGECRNTGDHRHDGSGTTSPTSCYTETPG